MVKSFDEIDNNLINEVCNFYEQNHDFNSLRKSFPYLDYYVLYSILYSKRKYAEYIYDNLCQTKLDDKKLLVISDTHYGSVYENLRYTYEAFNFAKGKGIRIVLHGGDIIESAIHAREGFNVIKQAEYFINKYPSDKDMVTHAILGNHDYLAIILEEVVREILDSRDDINILGFKKSFFDWYGNVISLRHEIEGYKLDLPPRADFLCFRGHSHFYHIRDVQKNGKNERIYIPSLSDDPISHVGVRPQFKAKDTIAKPGFLTAELTDDSIVVSNYTFNNNNAIVKENEYVKMLKR